MVAKNSSTARNTESMLEMLQRSEVSNPPGFGAKIASTVLGDEQLKKAWYEDMVTMSGRIRSMRTQLHDLLVSQGMLLWNFLSQSRTATNEQRNAW